MCDDAQSAAPGCEVPLSAGARPSSHHSEAFTAPPRRLPGEALPPIEASRARWDLSPSPSASLPSHARACSSLLHLPESLLEDVHEHKAPDGAGITALARHPTSLCRCRLVQDNELASQHGLDMGWTDTAGDTV